MLLSTCRALFPVPVTVVKLECRRSLSLSYRGSSLHIIKLDAFTAHILMLPKTGECLKMPPFSQILKTLSTSRVMQLNFYYYILSYFLLLQQFFPILLFWTLKGVVFVLSDFSAGVNCHKVFNILKKTFSCASAKYMVLTMNFNNWTIHDGIDNALQDVNWFQDEGNKIFRILKEVFHRQIVQKYHSRVLYFVG